MRRFPYLQRPLEDYNELVEETYNTRLYLLQEIGPTCFIVRGNSREMKYRVVIGNPHSCTCGKKNLCIHILYVLLKIFRLSKDNPLVWQLCILDTELDLIFRPSATVTTVNQINYLHRRQIISNEEAQAIRKDFTSEPCPICQEIMKKTEAVVYCKVSCGNNIHAECMKIWAENKIDNQKPITCPLCRQEWGYNSLHEIKDELKKMKKNIEKAVHKIACSNCNISTISGTLYRCIKCSNYSLCSKCYNLGIHQFHYFVLKRNVNSSWKPCTNNQLLDCTNLYTYLASTFPTLSNNNCIYCNQSNGVGRILNCSHFAHDNCIISALESSLYCPIDKMQYFPGLSKPQSIFFLKLELFLSRNPLKLDGISLNINSNNISNIDTNLQPAIEPEEYKSERPEGLFHFELQKQDKKIFKRIKPTSLHKSKPPSGRMSPITLELNGHSNNKIQSESKEALKKAVYNVKPPLYDIRRGKTPEIDNNDIFIGQVPIPKIEANHIKLPSIKANRVKEEIFTPELLEIEVKPFEYQRKISIDDSRNKRKGKLHKYIRVMRETQNNIDRDDILDVEAHHI